MPALQNLTGRTFGRLTVTSRSNAPGERPMWSAVCQCGRVTAVRAENLRQGVSTSCGCFQREVATQSGKAMLVHGLSDTRTYHSWRSMRVRCNDATSHNYRHYGGRGIVVCDRWNSFANFFADMGERPAGRTLDRINVNGNYEPGNCRWATASEQRRNRRDTQPIRSL